ncbi:hypothetical protein ASG72_14400 [Bosea sp. Leaf344]|uniref:protein-L-isoaspartate O-methyltransferase family protein n=1 Tax=Bosea sp. Leaf344 TaxID=1736346 RepID=UPI0007015574|nr:hypothetical protein [Bosea sp. Leaf344]KQU50993.1 hypothetical protein ASG72_14400 [Bosea sp. Leaf344]
MDSFAALRRMMVDCQLRTYDVTDRAVLAAADTVPREAFLPPDLSHLAYLDRSVAIPGTGRTLMAPMVVARMIQFLELQPGETVLEYGGGTGYGAALMALMGMEATLYEPDEAARALAGPALAAAGAAVTITGTAPAPQRFDAVLVSGACEIVPEPLFGLIKEEGRLIVVEGVGRAARVRLYQKTGASIAARTVFDAAAPILSEFKKVPGFVF